MNARLRTEAITDFQKSSFKLRVTKLLGRLQKIKNGLRY